MYEKISDIEKRKNLVNKLKNKINKEIKIKRKTIMNYINIMMIKIML